MRFPRLVIILLIASAIAAGASQATLPFKRVFRGERQFKRLVSDAKKDNWAALPIGARTAAVGQALVGTRYRHFTLEIDDHVEAPSVNFDGMDCWTFFEISLAFARMLDDPEAEWKPERMLHYIELDRYRDGQCTGDYLSRLHYLEDWLANNKQRGLLRDLTPELGGHSVPHAAREMSIGWRHYRYLVANPSLRGPLAHMEARVSSQPLYQIPKSKVASIESQLQDGDIIGIISRDRNGLYSTSHVGLALRRDDGTHFMHASSPNNSGKVIIDGRISQYLAKHGSDSGILVARPVR